MPRLKLNGLTLHVQQAGAGPDVILIHGVTGDLSIWYLCRAMTELAANHRVTAFDLRGHGYSDVPPAGYTSADHAADLLALMDEIGADRAKLVGHSFGAVVAMHAAVLAPDRVEAVVLSDPYFPALRHLEDLSRWGHWQAFHKEAADAGVDLSCEHWYDLGKFFDQVNHLDGDRLLRFRQAVGLPGLNRLLRLGRTTAGDDSKVEAGLTTELILGVRQPVLALYGDASPFLSTAEYLVEHLPNCRSVLIPNAQHRAPEENPEAFTAALKAWIESLGPAGVPAQGGGPMNPPIVLVTGAARGIGRATAFALAEKGCKLGLIDRDSGPLAEAACELEARGATVAASPADVSDRDALFAAVGEIEAKLGPIEVLIACAGIGGLTQVPDLDVAGLRAMLGVNVVGVAQSIEAVLPGMIARGSGHIVGVSSVAGFRGLPWMASYSASKAALSAYLEALRPALKRRGVTITTACPGFVRTALTRDTPFRNPVKMMEPEQAGRRIARAALRRPRNCVFPLGTSIGMAFLRHVPDPLFDWMMDRAGPRALTTDF